VPYSKVKTTSFF